MAVVLIACSDEHVLGWYLAREEKSRSWEALPSRIAPPEMVVTDGRRTLTHEQLVKARSSLNRLVNSNKLFTYLDEWLTLEGPMPATNNRIEYGVNAPLRQMLREHRGMSLMRRIKAVFWWCYMHCEYWVGAAETLRTMPTDDDIAAIYRGLGPQDELAGIIPKWGDAVMWSELHMIDYSHQAFRHDWA